MRYLHVCINAKDWCKLSQFYQDVFDCIPLKPRRDFSGEWVESVWGGLKGIHVEGEHIGVPGYAEGFDGPTLEIYTNNLPVDAPNSSITCYGLTHICFEVNNIREVLEKIIAHGGSVISKFEDPGSANCLFARDPEGNVVEIHLPWNSPHDVFSK